MNKILFKLIEGKGKFFLGMNWPVQSDYEAGGDPPERMAYVSPEYYDALELCISEALKNGEIVNPEVISIDWGLTKSGSGGLKDGEIFDLPEGMGFEEFKYRPGNKWIEAVRLLPEKPEQKEESQESLWASIINDARWYDGSPQDLIKLTIFFKSKFDTIKRKKS